MKTLEEKIEVMQAFLDGKTIQDNIDGNWTDWKSGNDPQFNWGTYDYRIKPENKQVPYDFKDIPNLVLHKFKHKNVQHTEEVCIRASEIGVSFCKEDISYLTLATYWEKWNNTLNRWESCTKTVKE